MYKSFGNSFILIAHTLLYYTYTHSDEESVLSSLYFTTLYNDDDDDL